tara:strand:+ start:431 stop:1531 length:1101 start_codon:yes stop_codon:yes gene_type:complete
MSAEQLTIMLNKQCGGVLSKAKTKVKAEGKKQVMKVLEKLPSKDDIKEKLISGACSIAAQEKMKKIYNKIHGLISKLESILSKAEGKLSSINAKITKVKEKVLKKILDIVLILAGIILVLKIIVAVVPIGLLALTGLFAVGKLIVTIANITLKAQSLVAEYDGTIKSIKAQITKYTKIALKILGVIVAAIAIVATVLAFVRKIKAFIEYLYLMYLSMCNTSNSSVMDENGNINESLLESEILENDPTGLGLEDSDLKEAASELAGLGNASGTTNQQTDYGLGGDSGLGGYAGTGIQGTTSGFGHTGIGNNSRPNNELYGISERLTRIYEDLILELEGQGKKEIVEHLNALDFGFQTRFERKIVPIN